MSKIKVTVEYETPPEDKFAALMAEYKAAKAVADEAKSTIQPLIDAGLEAKYEAVCEQLRGLGEKLAIYYNLVGGNVKVAIETKYMNKFGIVECYMWYTESDGLDCLFNKNSVFHYKPDKNHEIRYVLDHWNQLNIIPCLTSCLERKMQELIKSQEQIPSNLAEQLKAVREG